MATKKPAKAANKKKVAAPPVKKAASTVNKKAAAKPTKKAAVAPAKKAAAPKKLKMKTDSTKQPISKNRSKKDLVAKNQDGSVIEQDGTFVPPPGEPAILAPEDTGEGTGNEFLNTTALNEQAFESRPPTALVDAPMAKEQSHILFDHWYSDLRKAAVGEFGFSIKEVGEFDSDKFKPYYENGYTIQSALKKERKKLDEWNEENQKIEDDNKKIDEENAAVPVVSE